MKRHMEHSGSPGYGGHICNERSRVKAWAEHRTQKGRLSKQDWGQNLKGEIFQVGLEEMWQLLEDIWVQGENMYHHSSWSIGNTEKRKRPAGYKAVGILVWKINLKRGFSKYVLSFEADRKYCDPQCIDEETKNHPRPSGWVLVGGQRWFFRPTRDSSLLTLTCP